VSSETEDQLTIGTTVRLPIPGPPAALDSDGDGDDLTFALHRAATILQRRGRRVIDGTLGVLLDDDGRLIVLPSLRRALRELPPDDWAPYAPVEGETGYLSALRRHVFGGDRETAEPVVAVATPGGTGAVKLALGAFLDAGQTALTTSYHWQPYADIASQQGRRVATFDMFAGGGGGELAGQPMNVEALDRALAGIIAAQRRALLILNDPCHNPTGYSMTAADWAAVADIVAARARQAPIALLLDAAYADYAATGLSLAREAFARLAGRAVVAVAWSASKAFTAYGLRTGALLAIPAGGGRGGGHGQLALALSQAALASWGNCNRGATLVVERLLSDPGLSSALASERRGVIGLLEGRARRFRQSAQRHGLLHPRHDGGFFATVLSGQPSRVARALREQGAFVVPGRRSVRIALASVATMDIAPLLGALSRCLVQIEGAGT